MFMKMSVEKILVITFFMFILITATTPKTHAASGTNIAIDNIGHSAQSAWNAISDFMGEVWQDTTHLSSSFFQKIFTDIKTIIPDSIRTEGMLRDWLGQFIPPSLKRVFLAIQDLFSNIFRFIDDFIKHGFSALKSPANIKQ